MGIIGKLLSTKQVERALHYLLRKRGLDYLIPFLKGLSHVGRPTQVFFPPELLEQGLAMLLSGLNNTLAVQTYPHWVWPHWIEAQKDPHNPAFIPTGVNLLTPNLTERNWCSLGLPGSRHEIMVDRQGLLTPHAFGWSLLPYLKVENQSFVPPRLPEIKQRLTPQGPGVKTYYFLPFALSWKTHIQVLCFEGEEVAVMTQKLRNQSETLMEVVLGFSLRPYNMLTVGHINKVKVKNGLWRINRKPALFMPLKPTRLGVVSSEMQDPILEAFQLNTTQMRSASGLLIGYFEYEIRLAPGEKQEVSVMLPVHRSFPNRNFSHYSLENLQGAKKEAQKETQARTQKGFCLRLPNKVWVQGFEAIKSRIHVFDDQDYFTAGSYFYHEQWLRDSSFLALAHLQLGWFAQVESKLKAILALQTREGFFKSQDGEWDGAGQGIFIFWNYIRYSGDLSTLKRYYPAMRKAGAWIDKTRKEEPDSRSLHFGLLPAGLSAEHFGPNDHYFWDNFWGLWGLRALVEAAEALGDSQDQAEFEALAAAYEADLLSALEKALAREGTLCLPPSPYRQMDAAAVGNLVALSPLNLFSPQEAWVKPTLDWLWENSLQEGLFFQSIIHTGFNAYLSAQVARAFLMRGDPRLYPILEALSAAAGPLWTWPEAIHPHTGGGCMGDGDHGWAAAEWINLMHDLCVLETASGLILGAGFDPAWFVEGLRIKVEEAATPLGSLSYELRQEKKFLTFTWKLERGSCFARQPLFLALPQNHFAIPKGLSPFGVLRSLFPLEGEQGQIILPKNLNHEPKLELKP